MPSKQPFCFMNPRLECNTIPKQAVPICVLVAPYFTFNYTIKYHTLRDISDTQNNINIRTYIQLRCTLRLWRLYYAKKLMARFRQNVVSINVFAEWLSTFILMSVRVKPWHRCKTRTEKKLFIHVKFELLKKNTTW